MLGITVPHIAEAVVMYGIVHIIIMVFLAVYRRTERKAAIWVHYQLQAQQKGHLAKDVRACTEGKCALISTYVSLVKHNLNQGS